MQSLDPFTNRTDISFCFSDAQVPIEREEKSKIYNVLEDNECYTENKKEEIQEGGENNKAGKTGMLGMIFKGWSVKWLCEGCYLSKDLKEVRQ